MEKMLNEFKEEYICQYSLYLDVLTAQENCDE